MHARERSKRGTPTAGRGEEGTLEVASATHMHADSSQQLQHIICARASAASEARTLEAAGRGEESTLMRPLQSTRKQAACNSVDGFSTSHAHTRGRSERSTQAAVRSAESTRHAASAKHTHANSLHSTSFTGFSTPHAHTRERIDHSTRTAGRGEGGTLVQPLQSVRKQTACKSFSTSHAHTRAQQARHANRGQGRGGYT